jgi:hypothetical protein
MAVRGVPVPQENSLQLTAQATAPVLSHQQRGACGLREVAARPVGGSWGGLGGRVRAPWGGQALGLDPSSFQLLWLC